MNVIRIVNTIDNHYYLIENRIRSQKDVKVLYFE
ncbi:MAG: hypothetical protein ACI9LM_005560 [Alteromonadaceae bacterium]|jgi:hypothetical protein